MNLFSSRAALRLDGGEYEWLRKFFSSKLLMKILRLGKVETVTENISAEDHASAVELAKGKVAKKYNAKNIISAA